jgi:ubiquinone/menaquinone biosynthesis C-methylase UbiE
MELESQALEVLQQIGIRRGQTVLDFGCGSGTYTIPAAKIVGEQGKVYAVDKDNEALNELMQKAKLASLENIEDMETLGKPEIDLTDESVDVVLLFDVFHSYYFSQTSERGKLLGEIYRIMKPSAFISLWPKHMESEAKDEVKNANFHLEKEFSETLIHDNKNLEKGKVLNFRKGSANRDVRERRQYEQNSGNHRSKF